MNKLDNAKRAQIVRCLVEGNSIRATVRVTGASKNTIAKLLLELGAACLEYMDKAFVNLRCDKIQVDEIWSFIGCKQKNITSQLMEKGICGDIWTWIAIDADTRLIPCFSVGLRDAETAQNFIRDLAGRLRSRIQLTSDGLKLNVNAVLDAFGDDIDYAMLVKIYGGTDGDTQRRYSPAECVGCERHRVIGGPDPRYISTSYVERFGAREE